MAECSQEGCKESDLKCLFDGLHRWAQMMVKFKFVESSTLKAFYPYTVQLSRLYIWFLYVTQLPSPVWLVRNDTESEWNSQVAIVTVCCSVEVHVSHLKLKTERHRDVKKREGEKAREAVWASEQRKVILISCLHDATLWCMLVCCPADYDKPSQISPVQFFCLLLYLNIFLSIKGLVNPKRKFYLLSFCYKPVWISVFCKNTQGEILKTVVHALFHSVVLNRDWSF